MAGEYWCQECQRWVEESQVYPCSEEIDKSRGDMREFYEHELCGMEVTHADDR